MIEKKDIEKLATLSRIKLTEAEKESFQKEIDSILGYVAQIQKASGTVEGKLDLDQPENAFREDVPERQGGEYTRDLIDAAPYKEGDSVQVKHMF